MRGIIRHVLVRLLWKGSREEKEAERRETAVKQEYLRSIGIADVADTDAQGALTVDGSGPHQDGATEPNRTVIPCQAFWEHDEGFEELSKGVKDS